MTIAKAITLLIDEHDKAKNLEYVRDPVAYALYQVWKQADKEHPQKDEIDFDYNAEDV